MDWILRQLSSGEFWFRVVRVCFIAGVVGGSFFAGKKNANNKQIKWWGKVILAWMGAFFIGVVAGVCGGGYVLWSDEKEALGDENPFVIVVAMLLASLLGAFTRDDPKKDSSSL